MSEQDPKRLREDTGALSSLLDAGHGEMPSDAQMLRLAAKVGILGGLGGAGAAGLGGPGGAGPGTAGGALKAAGATTASVKAGLAAKVIGAVAIASTVGGGSWMVAERTVVTVTPVGLVATALPTATALGATALPSASAKADAPIEDGGPAAVAIRESASALPVPNTHGGSTAPREDGPQAEVKLLERAQDAIRTQPAEALALCNEHAQRFPRGMLVQEREVMAVEALLKAGRKEAARQRTDRFKARFPGSSHSRRLDALLRD